MRAVIASIFLVFVAGLLGPITVDSLSLAMYLSLVVIVVVSVVFSIVIVVSVIAIGSVSMHVDERNGRDSHIGLFLGDRSAPSSSS